MSLKLLQQLESQSQISMRSIDGPKSGKFYIVVSDHPMEHLYNVFHFVNRITPPFHALLFSQADNTISVVCLVII